MLEFLKLAVRFVVCWGFQIAARFSLIPTVMSTESFQSSKTKSKAEQTLYFKFIHLIS